MPSRPILTRRRSTWGAYFADEPETLFTITAPADTRKLLLDPYRHRPEEVSSSSRFRPSSLRHSLPNRVSD